MATMWSLVGLFAFVALSYSGPSPDPADILFKTNIQKMVDRPIVFEKPLPTWLKGTLVGILCFQLTFYCLNPVMFFNRLRANKPFSIYWDMFEMAFSPAFKHFLVKRN